MQDGQCVIGMQKPAMIPLIAFDVLVNVSISCSDKQGPLLIWPIGVPDDHVPCPAVEYDTRHSVLSLDTDLRGDRHVHVQERSTDAVECPVEARGYADVHRRHLHPYEQCCVSGLDDLLLWHIRTLC